MGRVIINKVPRTVKFKPAAEPAFATTHSLDYRAFGEVQAVHHFVRLTT
jgi:hypothetical protein